MITTLVLSAGSINGLMFAGAYRTLYSHGILHNVRTIIACSAGSIIGLMIALKYTPKEMYDMCCEILAEEGIPSIGLCNLVNLWNMGGLADSSCMKQYIRKILLKKHDQPDITFADLAKKTGVEFVVCGSNISKCVSEYFSFIDTPRMSIIEAVVISCCVPVLFRPVKYRGNYYLDGAVYNYLPIDVAKDNPENVLALWVVWRNDDKPSKNFLRICGNMMCGVTMGMTAKKATSNTCEFELMDTNNATFKVTFFNGAKRKIPQTMLDTLFDKGEETMDAWFQREQTSRGRQVTTEDAQLASPSHVAG